MCGLAGFIAPQSDWQLPGMRHHIQTMCSAIAHRGPDGKGYWIDEDRGVALGHRRLAVRDLSATGHQPMLSPSGRWILAFNGELYNHQDVRSELERYGHSFRGHSDTETLVVACEQWGPRAALSRFAGMFAIALWDTLEKGFYLARDRIGEKPLYYGKIGRTFAFASELKALTCLPGWTGQIDERAVGAYFDRGYVPAPMSIYEGIRKLRPGCLLQIPLGRHLGQIDETPYWALNEAIASGQASQITDPEEAVNALDRQLLRIVDEQMDSDVPLGAFLSGGIDSATIVSMMQRQSQKKIRTFTIGFDDPRIDESAQAKAVAQHLGTDHTEMRVTAADALVLLPQLGAIYDEPFADQSQLPTVLLARLTRQHVTVCLSGDGGDELFAGYSHYPKVLRMWHRLQAWPRAFSGQAALLSRYVAASMNQACKCFGCSVPRHAARLRTLSLILDSQSPVGIADAITNPSMAGLLPEGARLQRTVSDMEPAKDALSRLMANDQMVWLPDNILVKVDRATMSASLESRSPFIDHRIVELAWRIAPSLKLNAGTSKWVLRQVLSRYVPSKLFDRPKQGFCVPLASWMDGPLKSWRNDMLSSSLLRDYVPVESSASYQSQSKNGSTGIDRRLWSTLMFASWLDNQKHNRLENASQ